MGHVGDPVTHLPFYMRPLYRAIDREIMDDLDLALPAPSFHRFATGHTRIHHRRTHRETGHGAGDARLRPPLPTPSLRIRPG
jgi:hypothetical protein